MRLKISHVIAIVLLQTSLALGQTKYEKEERIQPQKVPLRARQFVDSLRFPKKVKWYFEQNLKGNSIEAKSKMDKRNYSIEFDTQGNLQDMEIGIGWEGIPAATIHAICSALHATYSSFQINKIQLQYAGESTALLSLARNLPAEGAYSTRYELVVKGKNDKQVKLYEITFDKHGAILSVSEIILRNTTHLEY